MRIAFLSRCLEAAGAERQLVTLAGGLARRGHAVEVLTFYSGGPLGAELAANGVRLHELAKRGRWDVAGFALRAARRLRAVRPQVVHGYLIAPNLLAAVLRPILDRARIVWGVRATGLEFGHYDALTRATFELGRILSRRVDLIVSNSRAGVEYHVRRGYPEERTIHIPNGIDTERFRPDRASGEPLRRDWGVGRGDRLVACVGRLDPQKDHETFLAAAARTSDPRLRFVCIGGTSRPERRAALERRAHELGLGSRLIWAGARSDMPAAYNALDLVVSSSAFGEGFSNAVGEAMACGVSCVVTDVGDSAAIVGELGIVVPPRDPAALARAIDDSSTGAPRPAPGRLRERVAREFGVERLVRRTERALSELLA